jgi:hypothetical protein
MSKLVKFFQKSRDGWKAKCREAKQRNKLLGNQVRAVEKSRTQWEAAARDARRRVRELERELENLKCAAGRTGTLAR